MPTVLVTGGCGFLGSHICELLKKESKTLPQEGIRNLIEWINTNKNLFNSL